MTNLSKKLNKEYLLKESKYFCMAPWVHMHMWPNGEAFPCCIVLADKNQKGMGNFNESSIKELWNSDSMRKFRLNAIKDKPTQISRFSLKKIVFKKKHDIAERRKPFWPTERKIGPKTACIPRL